MTTNGQNQSKLLYKLLPCKLLPWTGLLSLGLLLGVVPEAKSNSMSSQTQQFRSIEQPLGAKVGVILGGMTLIGLNVWWFVLSKPKVQKVEKDGD